MTKEKRTIETQIKRLRVMNKVRAYHLPLRTLLCVACVAVFCLSTILHPNTSSAIPRGTLTTTGSSFVLKISKEYPALIATKMIDKTEVAVGETVIVTVSIRNFGSQTAYNVTYIEKFSNPWVFNVTGLKTLSYTQIGPNETRVFGYSLTARALGRFDLLPAVIEYYDSEINPIKLTTFTNSIEITTIEPPEDFSLANFNAALILLISLILIDVILFLRLIAPKFDRREQQVKSF
jgi:hypothetical protein